MPYSGIALDALAIKIGVLLDDESEVYWTRTEKYYAIFEALRVWGGYTANWRARGAISLTVNQPYYELSAVLPALRTRSWTLSNMVQEIRFMLLENASAFDATGMSGQISLSSILESIGRARNRFVFDAMLPLQVNQLDASPSPPDGMCTLPQSSVFVHRAGWQNTASGIYTNLWRQDAWAFDHANQDWTLDPGAPIAFSVAETAPLGLQIYPIPLSEGILEIIDVESIALDLTNPATTFNIPDEWIHGVKYGALANLLNTESQLFDPLRWQYAEMRYQQAVRGAIGMKSIIRLMVNNRPVPLDAFASIDAAMPRWRNQVGAPLIAGAMNDFMIVAPVPDQLYGATIDLVQSAPLPVDGEGEIQLGREDLDFVVNYSTHVLTFKCGGNEFKSTFAHYDSFMSAIAKYERSNQAEVQYLTALFDQPEKEDALRPAVLTPPKGGG